MSTSENYTITVEAFILAPMSTVWECWTRPEHITQWCQASDDWHAPAAENDVVINGTFSTTMAAKDGSMSFDFKGVYDHIVENEIIAYTIEDGRKVKITFEAIGDCVHVIETFETENMNPKEMQMQGWQAILNSFKKYSENI